MIKTHDRQGILDYFKKLGMEIKTIEYRGCYFLTEKGQIKSVKIPYEKVVEKDCISIVDNYTYNFKQAKIRHKKMKIERICHEEDCD